MDKTSFFTEPTPGAPEGVDGIAHALRLFRSKYGVGYSEKAVSAARAAAANGLTVALVVDLRTIGDGLLHRLRYNTPSEDSGSYIDSDGVPVHVDSETYDFEFAVGLGVPEDVRLYAFDASGRHRFADAKKFGNIVFDGSSLVRRGATYRIFLSEDDVDPRWKKLVKSGQLDFFLSPEKQRRAAGSASGLIAGSSAVFLGSAIAGAAVLRFLRR